MTRSTYCLILCAISIKFTKYYCFFCLLLFIFSSVFLSHKSVYRVRFHSYTFWVSFKPNPAILIVHIKILIYFNKIIECNERCCSKQSLHPRHKGNLSSEIVHTVLSSISGFSSSHHRARSTRNIEWFLRNFVQFRFNGPMEFSKCLKIPQNLAFI